MPDSPGEQPQQSEGLAARLRALHLKVSTVEWQTKPSILLHRNIPKPLHGVAPRVVLGQRWWNEIRQAAYASTDFHCQACGVAQHLAKYRKVLEAHEEYDIDYLTGRMVYLRAVPLCHSCHSYIHCGRLERLVTIGKVTQIKYNDVMSHGDRILRIANLKKPQPYPGPFAEWEDWRLVIGSIEYPPKFKNLEEWMSYHDELNEE